MINKKGFTLIEAVVAILIVAIVAAVFLQACTTAALVHLSPTGSWSYGTLAKQSGSGNGAAIRVRRERVFSVPSKVRC